MSKRIILPGSAILLFLIAFGLSFLSTGPSHHLNVIVLTVESLRNDMVTPDTTPQLLSAGSAATRFQKHRAVSGWTGSNIVSLLTGLSSLQTGVHTRGQSLDADLLTPLERLALKGYLVEGIQGFMTMDIYQNLGLQVSVEEGDLRRRLGQLYQQDTPFFLWYQYLHTHLPYSSVQGYATETSRRLTAGTFEPGVTERLNLVRRKAGIHYDEARYQTSDIELIRDLQKSSVREFDDWFGEFWEFFNRSGLRRTTILVLTADHGDEHGERGLVGHASTTLQGHLHEEIVHVPLFIWLPENVDSPAPGTQIHKASTHEDIMPTVMGILGLNGDTVASGRHLYETNTNSTWIGMTSSGGFFEPDPGRIRYFEYGLLEDSWKLLVRRDAEGEDHFRLYDLDNDPEERHNLRSTRPEIAGELYQTLSVQMSSARTAPVIITQKQSPSSIPSYKPTWVIPAVNQRLSYDDCNGRFRLEWEGDPDADFVLEYSAGGGDEQLKGTLKVTGTVKDFGAISRRYWNTWVVPRSPFRLRVRDQNSQSWSDWIELEAVR